jgi:Domain of unknown function (DUF4342)
MTVDQVAKSLTTVVNGAKDLIAAANVRRVVVRNSNGATFLEAPVMVAAVITVVAPVITGFGAIAALVLDYDLALEKRRTEKRNQASV